MLRPLVSWLMPRMGPKGLEFARTRVEMKAIETVLHLRQQAPRRLKSMVPDHVWALVKPYGLAPQSDEVFQAITRMTNAPRRKSSAVPASRVGRMLRFGMLGGELALSARDRRRAAAVVRPAVDLAAAMLTPGNADMLARRLAALRGPAMKVGQILSLQGETSCPRSSATRSRCCARRAIRCPIRQLRRVLGREYGKGWQAEVRALRLRTGGGGSIGQLHRVRKHGGRELALKIQYPGVARSVDSDVDNLAGLLRRLDFLPVQLDVPALAAEAKRQLKLETDYESEARHLEHYRQLVADMPEVIVPRVDRSLTTRHILAMDWIEGEPLEVLASEAVPQARRNAVARTLYELMFRELFEFRFVQTDPNLANYLYLPATQQLALLDLGSVGEYPAAFVEGYRAPAGPAGRRRRGHPRGGIRHRLRAPGDPEPMIERVDFIQLVCEPLAHRGSTTSRVRAGEPRARPGPQGGVRPRAALAAAGDDVPAPQAAGHVPDLRAAARPLNVHASSSGSSEQPQESRRGRHGRAEL